MNDNVDICQICLRTDLKLKVINNTLAEYHDELCDYGVTMACTFSPKYCNICEHLLLKAYNFRAKCIMANKILHDRNKTKPFQKLYTLLPPPTLGLWIAQRIYMYTYNGKQQPMLTISGNKIHTTHVDDNKLNPTFTNLTKPPTSQQEETEVLLSNVGNENTVIELYDPLLNENEIKIEEGIDDRDTLPNFEIHLSNLNGDVQADEIEIKIEADKDSEEVKHDLKADVDASIENDKRGVSEVVEKLNTGLFDDNDIDELLNLVVSSDNDSLNSDDDCDPDNFLLDDKAYDRKQKLKQKKQIPKKKLKSNKALSDHNYLDSKSESMKKSLLELTNISLSDDDSEKIKRKIVKKSAAKKITNRKSKVSKINKDKATETETGFNDIVKRKRRIYARERLIRDLEMKFNSCGELKADDGTVLDKESILIALEHESTPIIRDLWKSISGIPVLTITALNKLKNIEITNKNYLKVFDIPHLDTKEKMVEEYEKRKTYRAYLEAPFKCDYCHQWFLHKKRLEYHMKRHVDVKLGDFICPICKKRTKTKLGLQTHINTHKTLYKCKLCPVMTIYRCNMINHYQQHQGVQHTCEHCNTTFRSWSSYRTHQGRSCRSNFRHFPCTRCGITFSSKTGLNLHTSYKHPGEPPVEENPDATCSSCSVTFASVDVYHKHVRLTHNLPGEGKDSLIIKRKRRANLMKPRAKTLICRVCNAKGSSYGWLSAHFRFEHPNVDMSVLYLDKAKHLCDICGKGYTSKFMLRDHMNRHFEKLPYKCAQCPKRFSCRNYLNNHLYYHGPPTYECGKCGKKFKSNGNLYCHMRSHIGNRRFKCDLCGKGFLHGGSLKEHVRGVHDNVKRVKKRVVKRTKDSEEESS